MRILNINSYYFSSGVHQSLSKKLMKSNNEFTTFAPVNKNFRRRKDVKIDELFVKPVYLYGRFDRFVFHRKQRITIATAKKEYNILNFDILHAHSLFTNGYTAMKLSDEFDIPYIVAVRSTDIETFFKYMIHLRRTGLNIIRKAKAVIFLSSTTKYNFINKYVPENEKESISMKSLVIPNGIDDFWLDNIYTPKKINTKSINFIFVGSIDKNKNIHTILKVLNKISKVHNTRLTVVGPIKDEKYFKSIEDSDLVDYKGILNKKDLMTEYRKNDIFIMPSFKETFGLVYGEAMSQGLPVIYTKGQGFDGQFPDNLVGVSVKANDIKEIENAINYIVNNYETMSKNCIEKASVFNWNKLSTVYLSLYEKVFADK